jgi:hypothetical protein
MSRGANDLRFITDAGDARGYGDLDMVEDEGLTSAISVALSILDKKEFFYLSGKPGIGIGPDPDYAILDPEDLADHASSHGLKSASKVAEDFSKWKTTGSV